MIVDIIDCGPDEWTIAVFDSDGTFCFEKHFRSEVAMRAWLEENEEWIEY